MVLMMDNSSTTWAMCGSNSLTHAPDLPCCAKLKREEATGSVLCPDVMPVMRCPMRTESGRSVPWYFFSLGL